MKNIFGTLAKKTQLHLKETIKQNKYLFFRFWEVFFFFFFWSLARSSRRTKNENNSDNSSCMYYKHIHDNDPTAILLTFHLRYVW